MANPYDQTAQGQPDYRQRLVDALSGANNTGYGGDALATAQPQGAPGPAPAASTSAPASHYDTRLMEGDPGKLGNTEHMAHSPKYDFLTLAQSGRYNYDQMPQMLDELRGGANGRLWQGWTADGHGNLHFTGNPSQLAPEWNGVTNVDAVGSYGNLANGGQAAGWRWGVDAPGGPAPTGASGRPIGGGFTAAPGVNPMLQSNAFGNVQQALSGFQDNSLLQRLIAQLSGASNG